MYYLLLTSSPLTFQDMAAVSYSIIQVFYHPEPSQVPE